MALVFVLVGQCGLQVGAEFFKAVTAELSAARGNPQAASLVHPSRPDGGPTARCVLVDAEPRVASRVAAAEPLLARAPAACGVGGRGGCWASGYSQAADVERSLLRRALAAVRKEVERCPAAPDLVLVHGLAGATGGGLACRLLEELRGAFGSLFLASVALLAPPSKDTSTLAPLAACLGLQFLQEYCDLVLLFDNGELLAALERDQKNASAAGGLPRVTLTDLNRHIGLALAAALLPCGGGPMARDLALSVCPVPARKFCDVRTHVIAHGAFETGPQAWAGAGSTVCAGSHGATASAALALLRGCGDTAAAQASAGEAALAAMRRPGVWPVVPWALPEDALSYRASPRPLAAISRPSIALVANRGAVAPKLAGTAAAADAMLAARAYVHWFEQRGVPAEALSDAVRCTRSIVASYEEAHGL